MAQAISRLVVQMDAENAKLHKKLEQSEKKLKGFGKSAKSSTDGLKKAFAGLAAAAGALQFGSAIKASLDTADKFAKMSQQVNVSVESLSTLEHAANLSGSSLQGMEKGFKRLSTNLLDANKGLKESQESFQMLGIDIKDSDGNLKSVESVLDDVADAFSKSKDSTEKTAIAMKLFGKAGAELIPMLNQGSAGIDEMQEEARKLGLEIGTNTAKSAELFNDNLTRLSSAFTGFLNVVLSKGLPVMVKLSELLMGGVKDQEKYSQATDKISASFKFLVQAGLVVKNTLDILATGFTSIFEALWQAVQGNFSAAIKVFTNANKSIKQDLDDILKGFAELEKPVKIAPISTGGISSIGSGINLNIAANDPVAKASKSVKDATGPMEEWVKLQEKAASLYADTRTPLENLTTSLIGYKELLDKGLISQDTFNRAVEEATTNMPGLSKEIEKTASTMDEFAKQAAGNIQDSFAQFLFDPFEGGMKGMLNGFADTLRRMSAELLAQQALRSFFSFGASNTSGGISNLFGSLMANVKHGGGMAGAGQMRNVSAMAFVNAPKFHNGGIAANEVPAILQKGEEVLTANDPRHRYNNGGGNVVNLTINATDGPSVIRSRGQIERELVASLGRAKRNA